MIQGDWELLIDTCLQQVRHDLMVCEIGGRDVLRSTLRRVSESTISCWQLDLTA